MSIQCTGHLKDLYVKLVQNIEKWPLQSQMGESGSLILLFLPHTLPQSVINTLIMAT